MRHILVRTWRAPAGPEPTDVLSLRHMEPADLVVVRDWLQEPHVARWFLAGSTPDREIDDLRECLAGTEPTEALVVLDDGRLIGWCQWYRCDSYPDHAASVVAARGDVGIDYAIGDPARVGHGIGTTLVATLVTHIRQRHPNAGVIADPEAANVASRRVLERNGFELLAERPVPSEPIDAPMAIYRLPPGRAGHP